MNWFDLFILILVAVSFISGYIVGFVKQLASIAGIVLGVLFSGKLAAVIMPYMQKIMGSSDYWAKPLSYVFAFLAIAISIMIIGRFIQKFIDAVELNTLNRLAGAFLSSLKYLLLINVLLSVLLILDKKDRIIDQDVRDNSITYPYVKKLNAYFIPFLDLKEPSEG